MSATPRFKPCPAYKDSGVECARAACVRESGGP